MSYQFQSILNQSFTANEYNRLNFIIETAEKHYANPNAVIESYILSIFIMEGANVGGKDHELLVCECDKSYADYVIETHAVSEESGLPYYRHRKVCHQCFTYIRDTKDLFENPTPYDKAYDKVTQEYHQLHNGYTIDVRTVLMTSAFHNHITHIAKCDTCALDKHINKALPFILDNENTEITLTELETMKFAITQRIGQLHNND